MYRLVLIRHGESTWNKENRFTGWTDVPLSEQGLKEAKEAGRLLTEEGFEFDLAYTSVLKRAIKTLWVILEEMDQQYVAVKKNWRLNERHYGALQGLDKAETAKKYGDDQVLQWRRSYDIPPPKLEEGDKRIDVDHPRYHGILPSEYPMGESLKNTVDRVIPYWNEEIIPEIERGKQIIIAAHGNSLRALVKHLDQLSDEEVVKLNIPTGIPIFYSLNENMKVMGCRYLGDPEAAKRAAMAVAKQAKLV